MNTEINDFVADYIDQHQARFSALSDAIWDRPETRFTETFAAGLLSTALEQEGFRIERAAGGIDTAFIASYGSGQPVIALLGEYDALAGLSQQAECSTRTPPAGRRQRTWLWPQSAGYRRAGRRLCGQSVAATERHPGHDSLLRLPRRRGRLRENLYGPRRTV